MPDDRLDIPLPADKSKHAEAQQVQTNAVAAKMDAFFDALETNSKVKKAEAVSADKVQRVSNLYYGLALDKAMKLGTGIDTNHFTPTTILKPIAKDERRYLQEVTTPLGTQMKSCIENVVTGARRLEHPLDFVNGKVHEPTLYAIADRCSVGRQVLDFYQVGQVSRTVGHYDIWHIIQGILQKTFTRTNKELKRKEAAVAYRAFSAPWNSHAFWQQFKSLAVRYFNEAGPDNPVFLAVYPIICKTRGVSSELQMNPTHRSELWHSLSGSKVLKCLGMQPVLGRWGNFETKHTGIVEDRGVILGVLLNMGIQKGWWPSVDSSPLCKVLPVMIDDEPDVDEGGGLEAPLAPPAGAGAGSSGDPAPPKLTVKQSTDEINRLRSKRVNTLDFACHFFADETGLEDLDAIVIANSGLVDFFNLFLSSHKTIMGQIHMFNSLTNGHLSTIIGDSWAKLSDPHALQSLHSLGTHDVDPIGLARDRKLAQLLFDATVCVTGEVALYEFEWTHCFYGIAPRLVDGTPDSISEASGFYHHHHYII